MHVALATKIVTLTLQTPDQHADCVVAPARTGALGSLRPTSIRAAGVSRTALALIASLRSTGVADNRDVGTVATAPGFVGSVATGRATRVALCDSCGCFSCSHEDAAPSCGFAAASNGGCEDDDSSDNAVTEAELRLLSGGVRDRDAVADRGGLDGDGGVAEEEEDEGREPDEGDVVNAGERTGRTGEVGDTYGGSEARGGATTLVMLAVARRRGGVLVETLSFELDPVVTVAQTVDISPLCVRTRIIRICASIE